MLSHCAISCGCALKFGESFFYVNDSAHVLTSDMLRATMPVHSLEVKRTRMRAILVRMNRVRHVHHLTHHASISYPGSLIQRFYSLVLGPVLVLACVFLLVRLFPAAVSVDTKLSFGTIALATLHTCIRLLIAYVLAVAVAVPLALLATRNSTVEEFLLPVFDILESVPILAIFPVIILVFLQFGFLNGAAIFVLFLAMLWDIVVTVVGGVKIIPKDIYDAAHAFGVKGSALIERVTLPAIVPQLVTGSIIALAQGWNLIIVAEVLHVYIPGGSSEQDLFGIGSILVNAASSGDHGTFTVAVFAIIAVIAALNLTVWQRLLHYSQRFRFD